jgi:HSP20 family molecular chaperone IbpA
MVSSNLNFGKQVAVTDNGVLQVKVVQVHAATKQKKTRINVALFHL